MSASPAEIEITREPGFVSLYAASLRRAAFRSQGRLSDGDVTRFPALSARWRDVRVDPSRLRAYAGVCGFDAETRVLPLSFPESLCLPLMAAIATSEAFPLSPFGLIHVGQTLTQTRALHVEEPLDLRCFVAGAQEGPRGITVRIAMTGDAGGERVWSGEAEMLSRSPETTRRARERGREHAAVRLADPERASRVAIDAPEDTGRRYARVSNDWNPHHLHWTVSRLLGYPQPIAHGMWTLARALAELERGGVGPIARTEVRFKKPLFLPGRATLRWNTEPAEVTFEVRETDGPAVHVTGLAAPG